MLYWFYRHLDINIFHYITVRAGVGFFIAFFLTLFLMPKFIKWTQRKKVNQPIYSLAPPSHQRKVNTPTMGGIVFIFSTITASLLTAKLNNIFVILAILTLILFCLIGLKDDIKKINNQNNNGGLSPFQKFLFQIVISVLISLLLFALADLPTSLYLPFYKKPILDLMGIAPIFWAIVITASSNSVNLTDGLDGLATVPSIFALSSLSVIVYITGNAVLSSYLFLPKINNVGEVSIIAVSLAGSLIGFLWYNCHPAQIFMGDSGSLALGGFLGYMAIISKSEVLLIAIGFVFVIETLSVIVQVASFKTRKKRVFLMAPIHHHFEQKKWHENKIIVRFWIIALISNIISLITLKIR
jgi:phospho-N-acetylmuramoyl-pentapeptide-transferase